MSVPFSEALAIRVPSWDIARQTIGDLWQSIWQTTLVCSEIVSYTVIAVAALFNGLGRDGDDDDTVAVVDDPDTGEEKGEAGMAKYGFAGFGERQHMPLGFGVVSIVASTCRELMS